MPAAERVFAALRARMWLQLWYQHVVDLSSTFPDLCSTTRSFISPASYQIFIRLCDSLVLLALAYTKFYPNIPFCPWLLGTEFVEHFFGLARMFLPNFAYAELVKMVQTIMLRQKILMMQKFQEGREKDSAAGYSFTYDPSPLTDDHRHTAFSCLTTQQLNVIVEVAYREAAQICKQILHIRVPILANGKTFMLTPLRAPHLSSNYQHQTPDDHDDTDLDDLDDMADDNVDDEDISGAGHLQTAESAAREVTAYSALCDDLEEAVKDSQAVFCSGGTSSSSLPSSAPEVLLTNCATLVVTSSFLDKDDVVSIPLMLQARLDCQSKATVHSERVMLLDPKFTVLRRTLNSLDPETKMTHQEASQRLAILQKQDSSFAPVKTARELRWKQASNAIARVIQPQGVSYY